MGAFGFKPVGPSSSLGENFADQARFAGLRGQAERIQESLKYPASTPKYSVETPSSSMIQALKAPLDAAVEQLKAVNQKLAPSP
jgi:hypothetical protein